MESQQSTNFRERLSYGVPIRGLVEEATTVDPDKLVCDLKENPGIEEPISAYVVISGTVSYTHLTLPTN